MAFARSENSKAMASFSLDAPQMGLVYAASEGEFSLVFALKGHGPRIPDVLPAKGTRIRQHLDRVYMDRVMRSCDLMMADSKKPSKLRLHLETGVAGDWRKQGLPPRIL